MTMPPARTFWMPPRFVPLAVPPDETFWTLCACSETLVARPPERMF